MLVTFLVTNIWKCYLYEMFQLILHSYIVWLFEFFIYAEHIASNKQISKSNRFLHVYV